MSEEPDHELIEARKRCEEMNSLFAIVEGNRPVDERRAIHDQAQAMKSALKRDGWDLTWNDRGIFSIKGRKSS